MRIGQSDYHHHFSGTKRCLTEKWDTFQYVPLLLSLTKLLSDNSVLELVQSFPQRIRSDGLIDDFVTVFGTSTF